MRKAAVFPAVVLLMVLCARPAALAQETVAHATINAERGYRSSSSGDPLAADGARASVSAEGVEPAAWGGIIYRTSAGRWGDKPVQLSAVVASTTPQARPYLWLRADGGTGKPLRFVTSAGMGAPTTGALEVDLQLPAGTTQIAFGMVMNGAGTTTAEGLKLAPSDRLPPVAEASAAQVYAAAVEFVFEHAYRASRLDRNQWLARPDLSTDPRTGYQAEAAIRALLRALGDAHSLYLGVEGAARYSRSGAAPSAAQVRLLDGNIGYVQMPAVPGTDPAMARAFALDVGKRLQAVNAGATCGWVVDLRKDQGGNMWPMMSALGLFFGDERLGGFKAADGSVQWWSLRTPNVTAVPGAAAARNARVAVLLGPGTASSGEAVAVAFIGRDNTRSFGAPTSGRASSNRRFDLPDGSAILLTTAVDVDRAGGEVGERIVPDVPLAEGQGTGDQVPEAATQWLAGACAVPSRG